MLRLCVGSLLVCHGGRVFPRFKCHWRFWRFMGRHFIKHLSSCRMTLTFSHDPWWDPRKNNSEGIAVPGWSHQRTGGQPWHHGPCGPPTSIAGQRCLVIAPFLHWEAAILLSLHSFLEVSPSVQPTLSGRVMKLYLLEEKYVHTLSEMIMSTKPKASTRCPFKEEDCRPSFKEILHMFWI